MLLILNEFSSNRPISYLPLISKLYEELPFKRLKSIIEKENIFVTHQFGLREKNSTIDMVNRLTEFLKESIRAKKGLTPRVETQNRTTSTQTTLLKSYINERMFEIKRQEQY